jgi:hypothetical protein
VIAMPERKGRKRKVARERRRGGDGSAGAATIDAARETPAPATKRLKPANSGGPLPSMTARVTGLMIAVITAFFATLMVYQSLTGDSSGVDGAARIVGGIVMVALAIVVGILSVAPAMVRDLFARRR